MGKQDLGAYLNFVIGQLRLFVFESVKVNEIQLCVLGCEVLNKKPNSLNEYFKRAVSNLDAVCFHSQL